MPRHAIKAICLGLFALALLSIAAHPQHSEDGVVYSHFEVVNNSNVGLKIQIYKDTDKSCLIPQREIVVKKNSRDTMRCRNGASQKRNRCKIIVKPVGKKRFICKNLRNECNRDAIRMPNWSRITIDTNESNNSGFSCTTAHRVTPGS